MQLDFIGAGVDGDLKRHLGSAVIVAGQGGEANAGEQRERASGDLGGGNSRHYRRAHSLNYCRFVYHCSFVFLFFVSICLNAADAGVRYRQPRRCVDLTALTESDAHCVDMREKEPSSSKSISAVTGTFVPQNRSSIRSKGLHDFISLMANPPQFFKVCPARSPRPSTA